MKIRGFNPDVIEPYFLSNLLEVYPQDFDVYHCSVYLICKLGAEQMVLSNIPESIPDYDTISTCTRNMIAMVTDFNDFAVYKLEWNTNHPEIPFAIIMKVTAPFFAAALRNIYTEKLAMEPERCEPEDLFRTHFALSDSEIELIRFTYFTGTNRYSVFDDSSSRTTTKQIISKVAAATAQPFHTTAELLSTGSRLNAINIIFFKEGFPTCEIPCLADNLITFIDGITSRKDLIEKYSRIDTGEVYPLDSFTVSGENADIIRHMVSSHNAFQILLYGEPGTGKTEFSKSIAASAGKRVRFLCSPGIEEKKNINRLWGLHVALNTVSDEDLLIVDEADAILNTETVFDADKFDKGRLNGLFDTLDKTIIWITNDIERIHPSVLRRFSYSIRFDQMKAAQREKIWETEAERHSLPLSKDTIHELSQRYDVNAAGIAHASSVTSLLEEKSAEQVTGVINRVLHSHNELIHGGIKLTVQSQRAEEFNPGFLNTDIPVERILSAASRVHMSGSMHDARRGLGAIFYGMPGTGKSETARYIADKLGMRLVQKKYSDLESKWVGETEQNIAKAFREAEDSNAILFLDEADALFSERAADTRSWEISRTNELLAQIDAFRGILICCTNLIDLMDSAAFRRFAFKVEFRPVSLERRRELYTHFFGAHGNLSAEQNQRIDAIDQLTPGDIRAVATSFMYEEKPSHDLIISAIEKECGFKKKGTQGKIGF